MTKEQFVNFISYYKKFASSIDEFSEKFFGGSDRVWESGIAAPVGYMLDIFIDSHFDEDQADLIYDYIFNSDDLDTLWEKLNG